MSRFIDIILEAKNPIDKNKKGVSKIEPDEATDYTNDKTDESEDEPTDKDTDDGEATDYTDDETDESEDEPTDDETDEPTDEDTDDGEATDYTESEEDIDISDDESSDANNEDSQDGEPEEEVSPDDKKNKELLNDFIRLKSIVKKFIDKTSNINIYNVNQVKIINQVNSNLNLVSDYIHNYIIFKFSDETYIRNLYFYNYCIEAVNINIEITKKINDFKK